MTKWFNKGAAAIMRQRCYWNIRASLMVGLRRSKKVCLLWWDSPSVLPFVLPPAGKTPGSNYHSPDRPFAFYRVMAVNRDTAWFDQTGSSGWAWADSSDAAVREHWCKEWSETPRTWWIQSEGVCLGGFNLAVIILLCVKCKSVGPHWRSTGQC